MLEFLAQHRRIDAQFLRDLMSKLIANDAARNALDVWKQIIQRLHLALGAADGKLGAGALNQVIEIALRVL